MILARDIPQNSDRPLRLDRARFQPQAQNRRRSPKRNRNTSASPSASRGPGPHRVCGCGWMCPSLRSFAVRPPASVCVGCARGACISRSFRSSVLPGEYNQNEDKRHQRHHEYSGYRDNRHQGRHMHCKSQGQSASETSMGEARTIGVRDVIGAVDGGTFGNREIISAVNEGRSGSETSKVL